MECRLETVNKDIHVVFNGDGGWCRSNLAYYRGLLVDTGPDPIVAARDVAAFRQALGETVITHPDIDHVGGLKLFPDAKLVAAAGSVAALDELNPRLMATLVKASFLFPASGPQFRENMGQFDLRGIVLRRPDETFEGEKTIRTDGGEVKLKSFSRCHSACDTVALLPGNVIIAGDLLFSKVTPIIWGNPDNWLKALDFILGLKPEALVPGHGGLMTAVEASGLKEYFLYLKERTAHYHGRQVPAAGAVPAIAGEMPDRFRSLLLPERLAVNVEAYYAMLDGTPAPGEYPALKRFKLFGKMRKAREHFRA
jgi:cyclase